MQNNRKDLEKIYCMLFDYLAELAIAMMSFSISGMGEEPRVVRLWTKNHLPTLCANVDMVTLDSSPSLTTVPVCTCRNAYFLFFKSILTLFTSSEPCIASLLI